MTSRPAHSVATRLPHKCADIAIMLRGAKASERLPAAVNTMLESGMAEIVAVDVLTQKLERIHA